MLRFGVLVPSAGSSFSGVDFCQHNHEIEERKQKC